MSFFDPSTDPTLRQQILTYVASELMTDSERARLLGLPEGCRIRERAKIICPERFQCGKQVWIGEGAILDAQGGLSVGDFTQIGLNVMVWSHTSHFQALRGETGLSREDIIYTPTSIGERCFIAGPSVIMPGVSIGNSVFIPPMSVVKESLPDGTVFQDDQREISRLKLKIENIERQVEQLLANNPRA